MSLMVKAFLLGKDEAVKDVRRFTVDEVVSCTFIILSTKTAGIFKIPNNSFSMYYRDKDGDLVSFSSNDELMTGLAFVKDNVFHLFIKEKEVRYQDFSPFAVGSTPHRGPSLPALHPHIFCDGCHSPVVGTRFKCSICYDYDLCTACQARGLHTEHAMLAIQRPQQSTSFSDDDQDFPPFAVGSTPHRGPSLPALHPHIFCDGCHSPVVGTRFKCSICYDYDLCSTCQARGLHTEHAMLAIQRP